MDRDTWLSIRKTGIGSSDAAAIAGLSPFSSALATYYKKIGEIPEEPESERMYWGTKLEPVIADAFAERTGFRVRRRNAILQHPAYTFALANLDRETRDSDGPAVLEIKNTSEWMADLWDGDTVPEQYAIQVHHQLLVAGYTHGYLCGLIGGNRLVWHRIERDEEILQSLIEIEADFWLNHVVPRIPPAADGSDASAEALKSVFGNRDPGKQTALPHDAAKIRDAYKAALKEEQEAEKRKKAAANQLRQMLQDAEVGMVGDQVVATVSKAGRLMVK